MKKDLYALILAGGASKRYGKNKILEKIGERTFLEIILEKVESLHLIPVIVYYYDEIANYKRNDCIFIKNPDPNTQQLDSMRLGIEKMHTDSLGFLVFLGDMPLIKNETIKMVIDEIQKEPEKIIVPEYNGKTGHPTFFPAAYYKKFFEDLKNGARTLVYGEKIIRKRTDDKFTVIGVNTKEELKRYLDEYKKID
ncbi:nucleotidyltransferase family protein [bacterium]|nr:nucleotidyltransferase family protein [bacterium]